MRYPSPDDAFVPTPTGNGYEFGIFRDAVFFGGVPTNPAEPYFVFPSHRVCYYSFDIWHGPVGHLLTVVACPADGPLP